MSLCTGLPRERVTSSPSNVRIRGPRNKAPRRPLSEAMSSFRGPTMPFAIASTWSFPSGSRLGCGSAAIFNSSTYLTSDAASPTEISWPFSTTSRRKSPYNVRRSGRSALPYRRGGRLEKLAATSGARARTLHEASRAAHSTAATACTCGACNSERWLPGISTISRLGATKLQPRSSGLSTDSTPVRSRTTRPR